MKKKLLTALALAICLGLCACAQRGGVAPASSAPGSRIEPAASAPAAPEQAAPSSTPPVQDLDSGTSQAPDGSTQEPDGTARGEALPEGQPATSSAAGAPGSVETDLGGFSLWLRNSIFISLSGVFLTLLVCSLGAYAFAKKRFAGSNALMGFLMLSMAIPFTATVVPLWLMMGKLHMIDHYFPLIAPIPSMLGLLLIRQAILSLPNELFESARVDGCRDLRIYWSIVLPVIKPILITVAILYFARSWNSFLWPLIISNTDATRTLPVGLASIQGTHTINYGITMAGALMNFLPPFLVYVFFQRYFIAGIAGTGIKN